MSKCVHLGGLFSSTTISPCQYTTPYLASEVKVVETANSQRWYITCGSLDLALLQTGLSNEQVCERQRSALADCQSLDSRTWLLGLGLTCSADQSCFRDSRLILCVVCWVGWGEEKEREEEQDGMGEERERRKGGGGTTVPVLEHLSLQLSPLVR